MRIITIIDQISSILVDSKIITKNDETKMPILDMNKQTEKKIIHPLHGFFIKTLNLIIHIVQGNPRAVRMFETDKAKFLQLTSHTKGELWTEAIKDHCLLAIKHLIDQSQDIKTRLIDLSLFEIEEDWKTILEKFEN